MRAVRLFWLESEAVVKILKSGFRGSSRETGVESDSWPSGTLTSHFSQFPHRPQEVSASVTRFHVNPQCSFDVQGCRVDKTTVPPSPDLLSSDGAHFDGLLTYFCETFQIHGINILPHAHAQYAGFSRVSNREGVQQSHRCLLEATSLHASKRTLNTHPSYRRRNSQDPMQAQLITSHIRDNRSRRAKY